MLRHFPGSGPPGRQFFLRVFDSGTGKVFFREKRLIVTFKHYKLIIYDNFPGQNFRVSLFRPGKLAFGKVAQRSSI